MTWFFLRVMVWLTYPLMALMIGALVVGGESESPVFAYNATISMGADTTQLNIIDVDHHLQFYVAGDIHFTQKYTWLSSDSLLYVHGNDYQVYGRGRENCPVDYVNQRNARAFCFSLNTERIAYLENGTLYTYNVHSGDVKTIAGDQDTFWLAVEWSHDGCRVAFVLSAGYNQASTLWIHDICQDTQSQIIENFLFPSSSELAWSSSGDYLAYIELIADTDAYLRILDVENGEHLNIPPPELRSFTPSGLNLSWSPTSNDLVFTAFEDGGRVSNIYVANVDSGEMARLTEPSSFDLMPEWSPDGTQIAFVSSTNTATGDQLYIMNADGSNVRRVVTLVGWAVVRAEWQPFR